MMRAFSARVILVLTGTLWGAGSGGLAATAGEMRVDQWRNTQSGVPQFVGIMGEVSRPGVFELAHPLPELADLVRFAGGTSASASGSVRIVRGGRMMQLFLSPKLHYLMLPNDLVIVESKQFSTVRNFADSKSGAGPQRNPDSASRNSEPTIVQLGLVNLIGRPVILDVTPGQAQLNQVLSLLRQATAGTGSISLIKPGSGMQEIPLDEAAETPLSSGTVLIFNPSAVNAGALPRLPNTVKPNSNPEGAAPSTVETTTPKATATDSVMRVVSDSADDRPLRLPQGDSSSPTRSLTVSSPAESVPNAFVGASRPVVDLPAAGENEIADPAVITNEEQSSETVEEPQPAADQNPTKSPRTISGTTWAILIGMLACCLAPWLWSRRKKPAYQPVIAAEPIETASTESGLERLISGSLKIVEEPLELPFESAIFGRPLKRPRLVFDRAHEIGGPHYANSAGTSAGHRRETNWQIAGVGSVSPPDPVDQGYAIAGARDDGPKLPETVSLSAKSEEMAAPLVDTSHERKVRVDKAHRRGDKGVLDRALATFEGERS